MTNALFNVAKFFAAFFAGMWFVGLMVETTIRVSGTNSAPLNLLVFIVIAAIVIRKLNNWRDDRVREGKPIIDVGKLPFTIAKWLIIFAITAYLVQYIAVGLNMGGLELSYFITFFFIVSFIVLGHFGEHIYSVLYENKQLEEER